MKIRDHSSIQLKGETELPDRRRYLQEYRQQQKEKMRILTETKPGQYIRNNPDYERIMAAIESEQTEARSHA